MKVYQYFCFLKIKELLTYRFEVLFALLISMFSMCINIFLWDTIYSGVDTMKGVSVHQMITYAALSVILGQLFRNSIEYELTGRIERGDIVIDFIRPTNIIFSYLAADVGMLVSNLLQRALPMLVISMLVYPLLSVQSIAQLFLFMLSVTCSYLILWLISALFGVIGFKLTNLGNINLVKDAIILFLSGSYIPLWFFPEGMQNVIRFFPFMYTYQTPLGIYIGKYESYEALQLVGIQALWIAILSVCLWQTWRWVNRFVLVQGG
jgi:ABC-2 type transport system permease protein